MRHTLRQISAAVIFCLCTSLQPCLAQGSDGAQRPLVTVTGEAEVRVVPDEVVFDLTVQTLNRDLRLAKAQTDERIRKTLELTRRYKIAAADVQTDYVRLEPRYRGGDETRTLVGYSVRKDLLFTLRDAAQAEELLSELIESGISRINSINFRSSQLRRHRDEARALAIKAAREKAVALTAEIGQRIGKAYSIEEEAPAFRSPAMLQNVITSADGDAAASSEGTLALGQIKVSARVTVRFILE